MALKFNPFTGTLDYVESAATKEKAEGVPTGGETSAVLTKKSATSYDDEWAKIKNASVAAAAGIEESKLSIPEMVKLTGAQTITGEKIFKGAQQFEKISFGAGPKEIVGLSNAVLEEGNLVLTKEQVFFGTTSNELKEVKISGKIENGTQFQETPDFAYNVLPEGGAAEIASIKSGATPSLARHRALLLGNISATETLTLLHEGAGLAENRFFFASEENVKLKPKQTILLWYAEGTKGAQSRWRDVGGSSVNLAAANVPAALKKITIAEAETGFEAHATKRAKVTAFLEAKGAEEYKYEQEIAGVAGPVFKVKAAATEELFNMGSYLLPGGKKWKVKKVTNEPKAFIFQATVLNN